MSSLTESVRAFAVKKHGTQVRKYTGEPYILHPLGVRALLVNYGYSDEVMLNAALLHDTVEDTDTTLEELQSLFGEEVSTLVYWLTDVSKPSDGNRAARKKLDREHIAKAPIEAQLIKVADLIHNTSSIVVYDPKFAKTYLEEKLQTLALMDEKVKATPIWQTAYQHCS